MIKSKQSLNRWSVVALLTFLIMPWCSVSADNEGSGAAGELAGLLEGYESYSATFIQIVVNENGRRVQETRGELKARRPGLFYWETSSPHSQFIVSDGEQVEVYDPDLEQVTIHKLDDRVATTPALLLSGEVDNLDESYRVSVRSFGENNQEFTLEPRDQDSLFVSLRLTFSGSELQEMRMQDSLAQLSVLSFKNIEVNGSIPKSTFSLDYPDTVDVIRDGA